MTIEEQLKELDQALVEVRRLAKAVRLVKYKRVEAGAAFKDSIIACIDGARGELKNLKEHLKL